MFVSDLLKSISDYAASRAPDISDDPGAIDQAMRWGFGWEIGPFELTKLLQGQPFSPPSFLKKHAQSFGKMQGHRCAISATASHASSFIRR